MKFDRKRLSPWEWAAAIGLLAAAFAAALVGLPFVTAACSAGGCPDRAPRQPPSEGRGLDADQP
jgi:hypothetical protein